MKYEDMEGIRRSDLWLINRSPAHFRYAMDNPEPPTPAQTFGIAAHKYILEPDSFVDEFAVAPDCDKRTKAGKETFAAFMDSVGGKSIISTEDYGKLKEMKKAIDSHKVAKEMLSNSEHEKPFLWTDPMTGEACKVKADCIGKWHDCDFIFDYKTSSSCEGNSFEHDARKYGYKFQAGMYVEGVFQSTLISRKFAFIVQEKTPPYAVRVYICTDEFVAQGYDKFRELIGIYHQCKGSGIWYGYDGPGFTPTELLEDAIHD